MTSKLMELHSLIETGIAHGLSGKDIAVHVLDALMEPGEGALIAAENQADLNVVGSFGAERAVILPWQTILTHIKESRDE